jgi:hypothetical protein
LHKAWLGDFRKLHLDPDSTSDSVRSLPLDKLRTVIPPIAELLAPCDIPDALLERKSDQPEYFLPPDIESYAPHRRNFWKYSSNGERYSSLGSFPLIRGVSKRQYEAVLETQQKLKSLKLLFPLESAETLEMTNNLEKLLETTRYRDLVDALILGLTFGEVHIHKGLDTGFSLPGGAAHVWGLAAPRSNQQLDIFVSQKAPSLIGTVLHTYLAHHGVSREKRYVEELSLERVNGATDNVELPTSLRTELAQATNAELLFLIEQARISNLGGPFADPLRDTCISLLIKESSRVQWVEAHSKGFLDGSVSMQDLLQMRLELFAKKGVQKLPSIDNLLQLFRTVDSIVTDALFTANRDRLHTILSALLVAYNPTEGASETKYIDINADLFALMFFCALRKHAFESVFMETTDRCPFFLTQPDQAAVFSELWVLGSQCDIYFGILPRELGAIIYNKYRSFLQDEPPPADAFNGTDVLTAYSFAHIADAEGPNPEHERDTGTSFSSLSGIREIIADFGALSIFCMPAIVDVCLLTFVGRGFFLTISMDINERVMASYALLSALLLAAGSTGWIGSVGGHYLYSVSISTAHCLAVFWFRMAN